MKHDKPLGANLAAARAFQHFKVITVTPVAICANCGADATCAVEGRPRCQKCANALVNLWNEIHANLDGNDS